MQVKKGQSIEDASMQMIEDEVGDHQYSNMEWQIVRRIIHSTADFDYINNNKIIFHKDAIRNGICAIKNHHSIIVDVNGVIGGLNKQNPIDFENDIVCNISRPDVAELARKEGKTRSQAAMRMAAKDMQDGIVAIGNAPTALQEVIQMIKEGIARPALVVGIPVGFICAAESKEELCSLDSTPFITNIGRKGGSPSASAIINALYKLVRAESFS